MSTEVIKSLQNSIEEFTTGFKGFQDSLTARLNATESRMATLEQGIKDKLIHETGPKTIPTNKWSFARLCAAVATKDWSYAPFEYEEIKKYREHTQQAGNFGLGGSFIPPLYSAEIITLLRTQLILPSLGVNIISGLTQAPVIVPKITAGSTAYWITEGNAPTASDLSTGQVQLLPKKCAALVKLSNDLQLLSSPSFEAIVRADIARTLADAIEKAAFQGTGVGGQPTGLDNNVPAIPTNTYTSTDTTTKVASWAKMLKVLDEANALNGNIAYAANTTAFWFLGSLTDTTGRPILQPNNSSNTASGPYLQGSILGIPVYRSTNIASGTAYAANWNDFLMGIWSNVEIASSSETSTAFQNDEMWIRAIARVDFGVRRKESLCRMTTITS
jgi:HK97 family phage major capsid protein